MGWLTGLLLYVVIWWVVLFAVLPIGTQPIAEPDAYTGWRGVPARPRLGIKLLATTLIAGLIWGGCYAVISSPILSFRSGPLALPQD